MSPTRRSRLALLPVLVLAAAAAAAEPAPRTGDPRVDEALPLRLEVGQIVEVCKGGTILCPAQAPICDDGDVVAWSFGPEGLLFTAVGPGETLCSAEAANRLRRVWRVTVVSRASR